MTREQFIHSRQKDWARFEELLKRFEFSRNPKLKATEISEFSALYRSLCFDLSLVQSREWGLTVSRYLNDLAARGHNCFYRSKPGSLLTIVRFITADFPRLLRANSAYFWFALALFVIPGCLAGVLIAIDVDWAGRIMSGEHREMFEKMYSSNLERGGDADAAMAGFYVHNNIGIALKCYATGAFAGLGTIFFLIFNSIFLGAVTAFVAVRGHGERFFSFVIGHGSFELTAIVVAGAAGLILGHSIVCPGKHSRWDNLRLRGLVSVKIALGSAFMLAVAALIEGFWSPSAVPAAVKFVVGGGLWLVVFLYLALAGRESSRSDTIDDGTPQHSEPLV